VKRWNQEIGISQSNLRLLCLVWFDLWHPWHLAFFGLVEIYEFLLIAGARIFWLKLPTSRISLMSCVWETTFYNSYSASPQYFPLYSSTLSSSSFCPTYQGNFVKYTFHYWVLFSFSLDLPQSTSCRQFQIPVCLFLWLLTSNPHSYLYFGTLHAESVPINSANKKFLHLTKYLR